MTTRRRILANNPIETTSTSASTFLAMLIDPAALGIANCGFRVEGYLVGREISSVRPVMLRFNGTFGIVSGTLTQYGAISYNIAAESSLLGCVPSLAVSSNQIQLFIAGLASKVILWTPWVEIFTGET